VQPDTTARTLESTCIASNVVSQDRQESRAVRHVVRYRFAARGGAVRAETVFWQCDVMIFVSEIWARPRDSSRQTR
jgi:hypothetical protein